MFYWEQKTVFGTWVPRSGVDRPEVKTEAGTRAKIRNVSPVPPEMQLFDLDTLQAEFGERVAA